MLIVVTGGSGSGKSSFAEEYIKSLRGNKRIYIATMIPYGNESNEKINKHRQMRKDSNFKTIECYTGISRIELEKDYNVLLECMSNLVANELYDKEGSGNSAAEVILDGINKINVSVCNLVVVTNEVFSDGVQYDIETEKYIKVLGEINQKLGAIADELYEVVYSIPICLKKRKGCQNQ